MAKASQCICIIKIGCLFRCSIIFILEKSNLRRLNVLQKRIIRIITRSSFDAHTALLFHKYHLLTLDNIHLLQVALFMFSVHFNSIPSTFQTMFNKNSVIHQYATRQTNDYKVHFSRTQTLYCLFWPIIMEFTP